VEKATDGPTISQVVTASGYSAANAANGCALCAAFIASKRIRGFAFTLG
jgi:hypothetical protein